MLHLGTGTCSSKNKYDPMHKYQQFMHRVIFVFRGARPCDLGNVIRGDFNTIREPSHDKTNIVDSA